MTNQELVQSDVRRLLEEAGGDFVGIYDKIINRVDETSRSTQIVNRSGRVERFKAALANRERFPLAKANKTFKTFIAKAKENVPLFASEEPRQMTVSEAKTLMELTQAAQEVKVVADAMWEEAKRVAFTHMTEQFAAQGEKFPEHINGSIDVPELGVRFAREGAGRQDPELNEKALRSLVGEDTWLRISDVSVIPAQKVESVSVPKLMEEAKSNPAVLDHFEAALKVGQWKKPKMNVRNI